MLLSPYICSVFLSFFLSQFIFQYLISSFVCTWSIHFTVLNQFIFLYLINSFFCTWSIHFSVLNQFIISTIEFHVILSFRKMLKCCRNNILRCVIFWPSPQPKNAIPRWYTGRKWHIPMASIRKRSRGRIKAYDMGQGEGLIVPLQWCTGRE